MAFPSLCPSHLRSAPRLLEKIGDQRASLAGSCAQSESQLNAAVRMIPAMRSIRRVSAQTIVALVAGAMRKPFPVLEVGTASPPARAKPAIAGAVSSCALTVRPHLAVHAMNRPVISLSTELPQPVTALASVAAHGGQRDLGLERRRVVTPGSLVHAVCHFLGPAARSRCRVSTYPAVQFPGASSFAIDLDAL